MDQAKFMEDSHKKFEVRGHALKISAPKRGRGSARRKQLGVGGGGARKGGQLNVDVHIKKKKISFFLLFRNAFNLL